MSRILNGLKPEKISKIPRGSTQEKKASDFLYNWAKEKNLDVIQDKELNILVKKSGTEYFAHREPPIHS